MFSMKNLFVFFCFCLIACVDTKVTTIDRRSVVERHQITITQSNPISPSQVGNGKFAFGVDITGLQTFVPFNTLSDWGWHSFPLPEGMSADDFRQSPLDTHGRAVLYDIPNPEQPELSQWLAGNPHRANLGRIGFILKKEDGTDATEKDIQNASQQIDLWTGIINSRFELQGKEVHVQTVCHPESDLIGVSVQSELMRDGRLSVFVDFPYQDGRGETKYVGNYDHPSKHSSVQEVLSATNVRISREMGDLSYDVSINWESPALFERQLETDHRFHLVPEKTNQFSFYCSFESEESYHGNMAVSDILEASKNGWEKYWMSGAAIDLSESKDSRWKELERRIVLSQYLMKVNESGLYPPQEAGLVNNGWFGRFHFEMIWWHGVHYGLWNRWDLFDSYLSVYTKFLPTSIERAKRQGYKGARWPKCTANFDRDWPHPIHATLIWQQPHPIYFAEMEYRINPSQETLEKWKDVVFHSADFMADYAFYDKEKGTYVLGPPIVIVSENTDMMTTCDPAFELSYWRYGLRTALEWCKRLGLPEDPQWKKVLDGLSPIPVQDGFYVTHDKIEEMWTKFTFEHPALTGIYGMLPGDGVDKNTFVKTLDKVVASWDFNRTWGWDFPMVAMAAARSGNQELAVDMLMHSSPGFQFDEHGLCTGGPFPYFPANGGLLTAIAMMCGGWDGSEGECPGFPTNGDWTIKAEGFIPMQ